MNFYLRKFIIRLIVLSLILGTIAYGLTFFLPKTYFSPALPFLFPFFFSATLILFYFLLKSAEKKFASFVNRFMLATFLKLLVYITFLLVYVFTRKEDAIPFIFSFFILYVVYTVFEVIAILKYPLPEKK